MSMPVLFRWEGDAMKPANPHWARRADAEFVIGERYQLEALEERSARSHAHYFAALHEAWLNLPEDKAEQFPSVEHLRKRALIKCGYRDERSIVCASKAEAQRLVAFMRPMDDYAVITSSEAVVVVYTAKSQSTRAMGKEVFQESKQKVLDLVAEMIGVEPAQLAADHIKPPPAQSDDQGRAGPQTPSDGQATQTLADRVNVVKVAMAKAADTAGLDAIWRLAGPLRKELEQADPEGLLVDISDAYEAAGRGLEG